MSQDHATTLFSFFKKSNPNRIIYRIYSKGFFSARDSLCRHYGIKSIVEFQKMNIGWNFKEKEDKKQEES